MLIAAGRYRAALRHFAAAYELAPPTSPIAIDSEPAGSAGGRRGEGEGESDVPPRIDDDDAWEAAVNGGLCIVELLSVRGASPLPIDRAVAWLRGALAAAPDEPQLLALLERAEALQAAPRAQQ